MYLIVGLGLMIQGIQLSEVCSRDEILDSGLGAFEDEVRM